MSYNTLDPNKTALLFFDMLNVYFRGSSEENQRKMEPIVANCVKVREVAMELRHPVVLREGGPPARRAGLGAPLLGHELRARTVGGS